MKFVSHAYPDTTATLYYTVQKISDGTVRQANGSYTAFVSADQALYAFTMSTAGESPVFISDSRIQNLGGREDYMLLIWLQSAGSPASNDIMLTSWGGIWDGNDLVTSSYSTNLSEITGPSGGGSSGLGTLDGVNATLDDMAIKISSLAREFAGV